MKENRELLRAGVFLVCAMMAVVGAGAQQPQAKPATPPEVWGGMHVSLTKTALGATLELDCAHGNILQAIPANGEFTASGTYTTERGGPVKKDAPAEIDATYKGSVSGDTMTLQITLAGQDQPVSTPLTLTRGKTAHLVKCR